MVAWRFPWLNRISITQPMVASNVYQAFLQLERGGKLHIVTKYVFSRKRYKVHTYNLPSWELTYPLKSPFWRWFSFSPGGICLIFLEGIFHYPPKKVRGSVDSILSSPVRIIGPGCNKSRELCLGVIWGSTGLLGRAGFSGSRSQIYLETSQGRREKTQKCHW